MGFNRGDGAMIFCEKLEVENGVFSSTSWESGEWRVKSWSKQNNVTLSYMNLGFDGELDF